MILFFSSFVYGQEYIESHNLSLARTQGYNRAVGFYYETNDVAVNITDIIRASNEDGALFTVWGNDTSNTYFYRDTFTADNMSVNWHLNASTVYVLTVHNSNCLNRNNANQFPDSVTYPILDTYGSWTGGAISDASCGSSGGWLLTDSDGYAILSINVTLSDASVCSQDLQNTSDFGWSNYTNCHEPYLRAWQQLQRNYTRYDNASCGTYSNTSFYEYINISCETFIYTNDFNNDEMILALVVFDLVMTALVIWLLFNGKIISGIFLGLVSLGVDFMLTGYMNENMMVYANTTLFALGMAIFTYVLPVAKVSLLVLGHKRG